MVEGRERKMPLRINGIAADSTSPATWCRLEQALEAAPRLNATGIGFVLAAERDVEAGWLPIVGVDLDNCRCAETGEIAPWALEVIKDLNSYSEISPSGTGVKVLLLVDRVPQLQGHKRVIAPSDGDGKAQQVEVYATGRYFALTGQWLDFTPDEITNGTEGFERLASTLTKSAPRAADVGAGE
jgi:primase-polymerase (primpol)-like protein